MRLSISREDLRKFNSFLFLEESKMPRSNKAYSTSSSSKPKFSPPTVYHAPKAPVPLPTSPPPMVYQPPAPSFGQIVKEGFGLGAGQAIAHRAVSAILGPPTLHTTTTPTSETKKFCLSENDAFEACMKIRAREDSCNEELTSYTRCLELQKKSH